MSTRWAHLRRWVPGLALLALTLMFARRVPWSEVWSGMRAASLPMLGLAFVANYIAVAARTALWWRFLCAIGITSVGLAIRAMIVGMALHCVLVGNAGEAGRVLLVMRSSGVRAGPIITSVVLERLAVSAGYLAVLVLAGTCLTLPAELQRWRIPAVVTLGLTVSLLTLLARQSDSPRGARMARPACAIRRGVRMLRSSVVRAIAGGGALVLVALTAVNWICQLVTFHWTAKAVGLPISIGGSAIAMLTVLASGSIRATPANVGVTQLVYVATASMLGLSGQVALGAALLLQAIQTVPVVLAGLVVLPDLATATRSRSCDQRTPPPESSSTSGCPLGISPGR
jgi:uncharacterized membrane protein YbhN (UPF0104 family)